MFTDYNFVYVLYLPMCAACLTHLILWSLMVLGKECRSYKSSWWCLSLLPPSLSNVRIYPQSLFPGDRGDSTDIIMATVWAGLSCLNFSRCVDVSVCLSKRPFCLGGPHSLLWSFAGFFSGVKGSGCEVDHLTPSSTKVNTEWNCASAVPCAPSWCGQGWLCHFVLFMF